jgi:hypothetical protein
MGDVRTGTGGDRCVCCGEIIPEGRQVCPACSEDAGRGAAGQRGRHSLREAWARWRTEHEQSKRGKTGRGRV